MYETITYEVADSVGWLTLNRPEVHNAFNVQMRQEIQQVWRGARGDDSVRCIVLTGAGEKAFCTGIDREETMGEGSAFQGAEQERTVGRLSTPLHFDDPGQEICPKTNDLWKPVIAAVNGMACGGALYMLGEVDIIIAAEHATFFDPHVTYGMVASFESIHLLQKLPLGETLRVQLMGAHERMSAERAHQVGLVSEVVPGADLRAAAGRVASAIASQPRLAVEATVRATWAAHEQGRRDALALGYAFVAMGTDRESVMAGQQVFSQGKRLEWRLR